MEPTPEGTRPVATPDPGLHLPLAELEARLAALPPAPKDVGHVVLLVARPGGDQRLLHAKAHLSARGGMPEDRWAKKDDRKDDQQLATMQAPVAALIANGQDPTLFGDNLLLDLDLSVGNLAVGTRLRAGGALLEVTPEPHDGCRKFRARFGADALRFVARRETRDRNLRGIYLKVVDDGTVAVGDEVRVLR